MVCRSDLGLGLLLCAGVLALSACGQVLSATGDSGPDIVRAENTPSAAAAAQTDANVD